MTYRSLLFAPATRPERFTRACESGADAVCLDLEDSVAPADKAVARAAAAKFFAGGPARGPAIGLRINAPGSAPGEADLCALPRGLDFILIPKVTGADAVARVARDVGRGVQLWPMIECPQGLRRVWDIAEAPGVTGLVFGAFDYVAEVGCAMDWEALLFARSLLAAACAGPRVQLLDAPSGDLQAADALTTSTEGARRLGFTGRCCIHPAQIAAVNRAFTPSATEVAQAHRVVAAFEASDGGAAQLDGRLLEAPVVAAARRTLGRAALDRREISSLATEGP